MNNKDFQLDLINFINGIKGLKFEARLDFFEDDKDDLVVNALPGGFVNQEYMDKSREVTLPFEIAIKSKINKAAMDAIWLITSKLADYDISWSSNSKTYNFIKLNVNRPALNGKDTQGYYVYTLQLNAVLEIGGK